MNLSLTKDFDKLYFKVQNVKLLGYFPKKKKFHVGNKIVLMLSVAFLLFLYTAYTNCMM